MSELAALVNIGSAGAVIAVVILFLRYIAKHDEQLTTALDKLVARIEALEGKFDKHDATEMEMLRTFQLQGQKTQPRKSSKASE